MCVCVCVCVYDVCVCVCILCVCVSVCVAQSASFPPHLSPPLSDQLGPRHCVRYSQASGDQGGNTAWAFTVVGASTLLSLNGVRGSGEGGEKEEAGRGGSGCSVAAEKPLGPISCAQRGRGCLPELGSLFQPRKGCCWAPTVYLIPPSPAQL